MSKSLHSRSVSVGKSELVGAYTVTEMQCTSDNLRESSSDSPLILILPQIYNRFNHTCKSERTASYHDIRRTILLLLPFHQRLQQSKFAHLLEINLNAEPYCSICYPSSLSTHQIGSLPIASRNLASKLSRRDFSMSLKNVNTA